MCGLAGVVGVAGADATIHTAGLLADLGHRGPDAAELESWDSGSLGAVRLAIVDLQTGCQPITSQDERFVLAFNGEIYNHLEIRAHLERRGHDFRTASEAEVILTLFLDCGTAAFRRLEGQFAIAIADRQRNTVWLARDHWGICPLYFSVRQRKELWFASESGPVQRALGLPINPSALLELSEFWGLEPGTTLYQHLDEVLPGEVVTWSASKMLRSTFREPFEFLVEEPCGVVDADGLDDALRSAVDGCLQGDVPIGACVSGGLDSALLAFIAAEQGVRDFFSLGFDDPDFDESRFQDSVVSTLPNDVRHHRLTLSKESLAMSVPAAIQAADSPLLRLAPAATLALSKLIRSTGVKGVLTGEGADELFLGYSIFRETRLRSAWARYPESPLFSRLAQSLGDGTPSRSYPAFLRRDLDDTGEATYGHELRRAQHRRRLMLFSPEFLATAEMTVGDRHREMRRFADPVRRAQVMEMTHFLQGYLLSSQGDRAFMRNSVEPRFPYLTRAVAQIAGKTPVSALVHGFRTKSCCYAGRRQESFLVTLCIDPSSPIGPRMLGCYRQLPASSSWLRTAPLA